MTAIDLPAFVEVVKNEIRRDIAAGIVPKSVASFSELHDYVDANLYGDAALPASLSTDEQIDVLNAAFDRVDQWLRRGRCL